MEEAIKDPETAKKTEEIEETKKATEKATEKAQAIQNETKNAVEAVEATVEEDIQEEKDDIDYLDRLQRTLAEFDNYRKRTEKEKTAMYDLGLSDTVSAILPVLDNFERALDAPCKDESYVKGMTMIYKQMIDLLESIGVTQIKAKGEQFDTDLHDAVMHIEDDQYEDNQIVAELQKGYIYKDEKVIRYSMVQVAN